MTAWVDIIFIKYANMSTNLVVVYSFLLLEISANIQQHLNKLKFVKFR